MAKTISFAIMHFTIAFAVAYLLTGSLVVGGAVALVEPAVNTLAFHFHERIWKRLDDQKVDKLVAGVIPRGPRQLITGRSHG